jgi:hypothetical protein
MYEFGNNKFLEEGTSVGGGGGMYKEDEYSSRPWISDPQPVSVETENEYSSEHPSVSDGESLAGPGFRPPSTEETSSDLPADLLDWDINGYDPGNPLTFPHGMEDFMQWWEEWWMPRNTDIFNAMFALSGTNSISGLGGQLGFGSGGPDPAGEAEQLMWIIQFVSMMPPILNADGEVIGGGSCWECFGGGGFGP